MTAALLSAALQLLAQQPHAPRIPLPLEVLPHPHLPSRPLPPHVENAAKLFDATGIGSPVLLNKGWRVGISTNPAATEAGFDDSAWAVRDAQESFADVPDANHLGDTSEDTGAPGPPGKTPPMQGHQHPFAWFRLHIELAPNHGPLALLIELPVSSGSTFGSGGVDADVFANGRQIFPEGPHPDNAGQYQPISRLYNLNVAPSETSLVLAIRTLYIPVGNSSYTNFFAGRKLRLGSPDDLNRVLELWSNHGLFERLPELVHAILLIILAFFLLALYLTQKGHAEYLWLALHEFFQAPLGFVDLANSSGWIDRLWYGAAAAQLMLIAAYLYFEFLITFLALRQRWYTQLLRFTAPVLLCVGPLLLSLGSHSNTAKLALLAVTIVSLLWIAGWLIFIVCTLVAATLRRNFEAGLLLIPLLLTLVGWIVPALADSVSNWGGAVHHMPLTLQAGPIPIHLAAVADYTGILVIVIIIFGRFLRVQRDQERASSELAAARSVQELMIPREKLETPGFEVESIYNPANEVGGDFYHIQPTPGGGLLVVVGDVAGKGLQAAMTVSMLMGALRRNPEQSPARILAALNRVLTGSESFTTCQAALFEASGELTIASAGHLPPYLNSQEVALPGGLPLGVLPEVSYEETRLYLHPGDRLLMLSDGVVEARSTSGELFGFDRVHNLSNQSAFYIADAAKDFGQEDDITVLTVRRLAEEAKA
jgi:HAMP domain-containing protein